MPEEILFKDERRQSRLEIANYLRTVADKLEAGESISFTSGEQSVSVEPPAEPTFEVKVERETSGGGEAAELSVELELEWPEGSGDSDGSLAID